MSAVVSLCVGRACRERPLGRDHRCTRGDGLSARWPGGRFVDSTAQPRYLQQKLTASPGRRAAIFPPETVTVNVSDETPGTDLDLYLFGPDATTEERHGGAVASSTTTSNPETLTFTTPAGSGGPIQLARCYHDVLQRLIRGRRARGRAS